MSEIPERIEREMFEIRNRMAPDVTDFRQHVEPKAVVGKVKKNLTQRVKTALAGLGERLKTQGQEFVDSSRNQLHIAGEAGKKRDASAFTGAVKSDPKPMVLLAIVFVLTLMMARRLNGKGE